LGVFGFLGRGERGEDGGGVVMLKTRRTGSVCWLLSEPFVWNQRQDVKLMNPTRAGTPNTRSIAGGRVSAPPIALLPLLPPSSSSYSLPTIPTTVHHNFLKKNKV
jgi:hypothetical protein